MEALIIIMFVVGYLAITMEHNLKIDKLIPALAMMAILGAVIGLSGMNVYDVNTELQVLEQGTLDDILLHHMGKTAEILIFLMGAMTIVEIIDYFDGFATIKGYIKTKSKKKLLWLFTILGFVLSSIIDNLTATIVLVTILQKVINDRETRMWFAGIIVIATNAGGAWSPIGDVTTTMLWIADKVSTVQLVLHVLVPSIVCAVIPVLIASRQKAFEGNIDAELEKEPNKSKYGATMLYLGLGAIIFVPFFKAITHLPPYVGMMLSLAVVATFAEIFSRTKFSISNIDGDSDEASHHSPVHHSLSKIELPSILFFLGILMAVAALESLGMLFHFAGNLNEVMPMLGTESRGGPFPDLECRSFGWAPRFLVIFPWERAGIGCFS